MVPPRQPNLMPLCLDGYLSNLFDLSSMCRRSFVFLAGLMLWSRSSTPATRLRVASGFQADVSANLDVLRVCWF
jgi:hypothetical protein